MPDIQEIMQADQREMVGLHKDEKVCALDLDEAKRKAASLGAGHLEKGPFKKLKRFLAQIAGLQTKESDLLGQIEKIENKHAEMKRQHLLRQAEMPKANALDNEIDQKPARRRKGLSLWDVLAFLAFFGESDQKKNDPQPH